ncbi:MAG: response regulator transcription factor [Epsilonproteobacteria bacterium]|nr:response regulator transcription factor [Campylobacterota bacterium]
MDILIIDDQEDILELLKYTLESDYRVYTFKDTSEVEQFLVNHNVDILLMDRNLPNIEGSEFVEYLLKKGYDFGVIYISAKDSSEDILEGFAKGADDYITKPFNLAELKARIKALAKRLHKLDTLTFRDIIYDISKSEVYIEDELIPLTHLEKKLLLEFLKNPNIVLSKDYLLNNVWDNSFDVSYKALNMAIKRLKQKIDPTNQKQYIKNIRAQGYKIC